MIEVRSVDAGYGPITVVRGVSLTLSDNETYVLLGANGAGKTTLANAIVGFTKCRRGTITFDNVDVTNLPIEARARMGMSIVPEGRRLFSELTVSENLRLGGYNTNRDKFREQIDFVNGLFPILKELRDSAASRLSGGQQQMLAIARALVSSPKFLILDEPLTGLMPQAVTEVLETIHILKQNGVSVFLVEQNLRQAISVADKVALMQNGQIVLESKPGDVVENEIVKSAYLG